MVQVLIIGGGFAGMALSLFLKKQNVTSAIYELRDEDYTAGGNIALAPNALRALDHAGVFERLRTQGYNYDKIAFVNAKGATLGTFLNGSQQEYDYHAVRIHRTIIRDELRAEVRRQGISMTYQKKFIGITHEGDKVTCEFADGEKISAEFIIGCDGMHSAVRQYLNQEHPKFSGLTGIMGTVDASELQSIKATFSVPAMLFGDTGSFAIMPSSFSGDEIGYFASIEMDDRSRQEWAKLGDDKEQLLKILQEKFHGRTKWPELVEQLIKKTPNDTLTCWPFFSAPTLEHYYSSTSRIVLIGDAAHAIPPTGGQGAAMALEDAETLAYALALALGRDQASKNAELQATFTKDVISKWEIHRRQRVAKVMDFTSKNGQLRKSSAHYVEQAAKEWVMWLAFHWMGPEGGARWMYEYTAETVRRDLI